MKLLVIFIALPAVISSFDKLTGTGNNFTINATGYLGELTRRTLKGIYEDPDFDVDLLQIYNGNVEGSGVTLTLEQCGVQRLENITHGAAINLDYNTIPALDTMYTIETSVIHFKFVVSENGSEEVSMGYGTFELSGVADSIIIGAYENTAGNYSSEVLMNKLSGMGVIGNITFSDRPVVNMEAYVEAIYRTYFETFSDIARSAFELYFFDIFEKVDVGKYIVKY